jgi:hypothetical protein
MNALDEFLSNQAPVKNAKNPKDVNRENVSFVRESSVHGSNKSLLEARQSDAHTTSMAQFNAGIANLKLEDIG